MRLPSLSIRTRLTVWYTFMLALALFIAFYVVYQREKHALDEALQDTLEVRAELIESLLRQNGNERDLSAALSDEDLDDTFHRLIEASGNIVFDNSAQYGPVPFDMADLPDPAGRRREWTVKPGGDDNAGTLLLSVRLDLPGQPILQVGETREEEKDALETLLGVMLKVGPLLLIPAAIGGYWISSRALRPVNEVTKMAQTISSGDLSRRLNLRLPNDEVGRLAKTFDEMIERIDRLIRRQRQFTADASHELRTPLAAMRGQVEVAMEQTRAPEDYQRTLSYVDRELQRMTHLVEALLMIARAESGAVVLERERIDVAQLAELVEELGGPLAEAKGLTFRIEPGPEVHLFGDEALLLQAVLNLVDNAVRYTETGEVVLSWSLAGQNVAISVRDTGPGIPAAEEEKIFEAFYRLDASRSGVPGAGLGLSICRWIVQAHGGTISVESSESGAKFTMSLAAA